MKVLVTGAKGFIGKNLITILKTMDNIQVLSVTSKTPHSTFENYVECCDFVIHLAGVNRAQEPNRFWEGNYRTTLELTELLSRYNKKVPVIFASTIQTSMDNEYGKSKKAAEEVLVDYAKRNKSKVYIYPLKNVFGKWSKPDYNSVVATFCHHIAHNEPIRIDNPNKVIKFIYIDDVVQSFIEKVSIKKRILEPVVDYIEVEPIYEISLQSLAELIQSFYEVKQNLYIPHEKDTFTRNLYSTYLSYIEEEELKYDLVTHKDERGSFSELLRSRDSGQVSLNISKPGAIKGDHWHQTKHEKFIVIQGQGVIQLRKIGTDKVITYTVSGDRLQVIDIPPGITHNIINTGEDDLITVIWCNECFDPENPDTYYEEVNRV